MVWWWWWCGGGGGVVVVVVWWCGGSGGVVVVVVVVLLPLCFYHYALVRSHRLWKILNINLFQPSYGRARRRLGHSGLIQ